MIFIHDWQRSPAQESYRSSGEGLADETIDYRCEDIKKVGELREDIGAIR
jgi:hypothetical protein